MKTSRLVIALIAVLSVLVLGTMEVSGQSLTVHEPTWTVGVSDTLKYSVENTDNTEVSATYFKFVYDASVMQIDTVYADVDNWKLVYLNSPGEIEVALLTMQYRVFDGPLFSIVTSPQTSGSTAFALADLSWVDCNDIITVPPDTTTRPTDPSPEEVAALYPGTTYWVDALRGVDSNDCLSWDSPCRNTDPFESLLDPGDAVIFNEGVHRIYINVSQSGNNTNRIVYAGYPGKEVVLSGADIWTTSWTDNGNGTWTMPYTQSLPEHPQENEPDQDPYRPELLVVNDNFYGTVYDIGDVVEGTFYTEGPSTSPTSITGHFGDLNPNDEKIEVGVRPQILEGTADYIQVKDLVFQHGPSSFGHKGCLQVTGNYWAVDSVVVQYCNNNGIRIEGTAHTFTDVWSNYNGMMGLHTFAADYVSHIRGGVIGNNTKGFDHAWHAGGHKVTHGASHNVWDGFHALGNDGPGLWFDIPWNEYNEVKNSFFQGNSMAGVMLEHGTVYTNVHHNVIYGTRKYFGVGPGIRVQAASDNRIHHNIIYQNEGNGVREKFTDLRSPPGHNWWHDNILTHNGGSSDGDFEFRIIRNANEKIVDHFYNNVFVERPGLSVWAVDESPLGSGTSDLNLWHSWNLQGEPSDTLYSRSTPVLSDPTSADGWRPVIGDQYGPQN